MSRLSFRPRPLDIHKKLPIVKSARELEDDETTLALRAAPPVLRHSQPEPAADGEVMHGVLRYLSLLFWWSGSLPVLHN